jgi:protein phosphatase
VGGQPGGAVAACIAARVIRRGWRRLLGELQPARPNALLEQVDHFDPLCDALIHLLEEAHEHVRAEGPLHPDAQGGHPETTVALAIFSHAPNTSGYLMTYAWVGDSRVYLHRDRGVEPCAQLTQDDGLLTMLVRERAISTHDALRIDQAIFAGLLSETERAYFEQRHGLSQALGDPIPPVVHVKQVALEAGDRVLLCTDGIHDNMTRYEIAVLLASARHTTGASQLVESAQQRARRDTDVWMRAKPDDMTAVVVTWSPCGTPPCGLSRSLVHHPGGGSL